MKNETPNTAADNINPIHPGTTSGSRIPIAVARHASGAMPTDDSRSVPDTTSASAPPPFERAKTDRHAKGESITAIPSVLHVAATKAAAAPFVLRSGRRRAFERPFKGADHRTKKNLAGCLGFAAGFTSRWAAPLQDQRGQEPSDFDQ
jgi:hypothetical protein